MYHLLDIVSHMGPVAYTWEKKRNPKQSSDIHPSYPGVLFRRSPQWWPCSTELQLWADPSEWKHREWGDKGDCQGPPRRTRDSGLQAQSKIQPAKMKNRQILCSVQETFVDNEDMRTNFQIFVPGCLEHLFNLLTQQLILRLNYELRVILVKSFASMYHNKAAFFC